MQNNNTSKGNTSPKSKHSKYKSTFAPVNEQYIEETGPSIPPTPHRTGDKEGSYRQVLRS